MQALSGTALYGLDSDMNSEPLFSTYRAVEEHAMHVVVAQVIMHGQPVIFVAAQAGYEVEILRYLLQG